VAVAKLSLKLLTWFIAVKEIPEVFFEQLAPGGSMVYFFSF